MSQIAPPDLLHEYFWRRVALAPDDIALYEEGGRNISFAELGARVQSLAQGLAEQGIGPGSLVGLHMDRSIDWVAAALAILAVDAAVVPLPPTYPSARIREILDFARLDVVIDSQETPLEPSMPAPRLDLVHLFANSGTPYQCAAGEPEHSAFVLCSSGSTGHPKMIVRSHRSFFHRLRWTWENHPYEPGERCCQKSHMTTTHAIYELFEPLLRGIAVTIIPDREVRDLGRFWDIVRSERISRLLLVPAQLQSSLGMPDFVPPDLNVVVLMGEYVSPALAAQALSTFPASTAIYSIYGSTEASSTLVCDLRESFRPGRELPLGRPISSDITATVLDREGRPAPGGEVGRLHIAGPALFTEYLHDPESTAASFGRASGASAHLYDTADEVRQTADGQLEFLGRADHMVKIRGFRVDLQEVEGALLAQPGITEAAVVAVDGGHGAKTLHGFTVPASTDTGAVYRALREKMPDYMVPSRLTVLERLPLTASGKIDRLRLQRNQIELIPNTPSALQLSDTEKDVSATWREIVGGNDHPADASFFEVGGTSLTAFTLVHRLRQRFNLTTSQLDVEAVYRHATIKNLASYIERVQLSGRLSRDSAGSILVTLRRGRDAGLAPVFFVAPAGGGLGSYGKLARYLDTTRELIGVRDPFNWGARDPSEGFDHWIDLYLEALKRRQSKGPYHLVAYSSAAAFGYEMACRLRAAGQQVELLALIDPIGIDRRGRSRYGWWVVKASTAHPVFRTLILLLGWCRVKPLSQIPWLAALLSRRVRQSPVWKPEHAMQQATQDRFRVLSLSALLELNSGIPYALAESELDGVAPEDYMSVLRARVESLSPEVDFSTIQSVARQYPLQLRGQEYYQPQPYDGEVLLVEASKPYAGLVSAQLRPYVRRLRRKAISLGEPSQRVKEIATRWGLSAAHFRCMRDDHFVEQLAVELRTLLD